MNVSIVTIPETSRDISDVAHISVAECLHADVRLKLTPELRPELAQK